MASLDPIFSTMPLARRPSSSMRMNWNLMDELPLLRTRTFMPCLSPQVADDIPLVIEDPDVHRRLARPGVSGAAETGVIGPEGHLDDVQEPVADLSLLDERHGRLLGGGVGGGVVF